MSTTHFYQVQVDWVAGRKGVMNSEVLPSTIEVATPPEFPEGLAGIWSPEHLFVSAIASCLMTTFLAIAAASKLEFSDFTCNAIGKLEQVDGKFSITEVVLQPSVSVPAGTDTAKVLRIIEKADANCLISNSVKSIVTLQPTVNTAV